MDVGKLTINELKENLSSKDATHVEYVLWKLADYVATSKLGYANGVATLDGTGKVPLTQLPDGIGGNSTIAEVLHNGNDAAGNIIQNLGKLVVDGTNTEAGSNAIYNGGRTLLKGSVAIPGVSGVSAEALNEVDIKQSISNSLLGGLRLDAGHSIGSNNTYCKVLTITYNGDWATNISSIMVTTMEGRRYLVNWRMRRTTGIGYEALIHCDDSVGATEWGYIPTASGVEIWVKRVKYSEYMYGTVLTALNATTTTVYTSDLAANTTTTQPPGLVQATFYSPYTARAEVLDPLSTNLFKGYNLELLFPENKGKYLGVFKVEVPNVGDRSTAALNISYRNNDIDTVTTNFVLSWDVYHKSNGEINIVLSADHPLGCEMFCYKKPTGTTVYIYRSTSVIGTEQVYATPIQANVLGSAKANQVYHIYQADFTGMQPAISNKAYMYTTAQGTIITEIVNEDSTFRMTFEGIVDDLLDDSNNTVYSKYIGRPGQRVVYTSAYATPINTSYPAAHTWLYCEIDSFYSTESLYSQLNSTTRSENIVPGDTGYLGLSGAYYSSNDGLRDGVMRVINNTSYGDLNDPDTYYGYKGASLDEINNLFREVVTHGEAVAYRLFRSTFGVQMGFRLVIEGRLL